MGELTYPGNGIPDAFRSVLDELPGGVLVYRGTREKEILYASKGVIQMLECKDAHEFINYTFGSFRHFVYIDDVGRVEREIDEQMRSSKDLHDYVNYRVRTITGKIVYVENFVRRVKLPGEGDVFCAFVMDSRVKDLTRDIDSLTGFPGQKRFLGHAGNELKHRSFNTEAPETAILYFNIKNFKMFNVQYGGKEGDQLLRDVADILKEVFPHDYIARFADDHFVVLTDYVDLKLRAREVYQKLVSLRSGVRLDAKFGVYHVTDFNVNPELACDLAKLACDSIRDRLDVHILEYTDEVWNLSELRNYAVYHIDEALKNGYIKVYYQPVMRSLSGTLCGLEALARWEDPEKGFISTGIFIPALEDSRQISKLDMYMIEHVCQNYRERVNRGEPVVPVSFNLSRIDFFTCEVLEELNRITDKYCVPHYMLNVEITESVFVHDFRKISEEIDNFHKAGFQVWMDDFGSGYSSLNVLKDYSFDELKIDMEFLAHFTEKAKSVIESTVRMAKKIGVQTLAEGVETKEQLNFLKSIGCEKIQGYYFGKPMPYDNVVERIKEQHWVTETREMAQYYDAAGREDFLTNCPFALLEDDGTKFRYLFVNNEFMKSLATAGTTSTDMSEHMINDNASPLSHLFRNFANEIAESGKEQVLTYTSKNQYMRLRCKTIASCGNKHIHRAELINVTFNSDQRQQDMLDGLVRSIYYLYNTVFIINFDENSCNPIVASASSWEFLHQKTYGLEEVRLSYARQNIHPDDQERFLEFVRLDNMEQRIEDSPEGMIADYFRTKGADGNFTWDVHTIISIPKTNGKVFLYTAKLSPLDDETLRKHVLKEYIKDDKPELKTAENKAE
ncbi:EAL domain-containing protein [uncultured Dialister sp.]|uniref:EAL domain-containing protein n=1 Tax=uncultured Dialister sp. TaxID=278064 RepID=UPI00265F9117|nr:EAL domain-containing protein [uncultured Dialister sp.]